MFSQVYSTPLNFPKALYIQNKVLYTICKTEVNQKLKSYTEHCFSHTQFVTKLDLYLSNSF